MSDLAIIEDYAAAAVRHFYDATELRLQGRKDNAGHLVGFAAECAIKHSYQAQGFGSPHRQHIPEILCTVQKLHKNRSGYTEMYNVLKIAKFTGWIVDRRYGSTDHTLDSELEEWFGAARRILSAAKLKVRR